MRLPSKTRLLVAGGLLVALRQLLTRHSPSAIAPSAEPIGIPQPAHANAASETFDHEGAQHLAERDAARQRAADDGFGGSVAAAPATVVQRPASGPQAC